SGSSVSSPVMVQAAAKVTGTLSSVQLWIDGVKKYSTGSSTLNTSISVATGSHRFAVIAVNTAGQKWESAVNATVQ
ncbi:MAG TPA: Ig-like domain-containing protein, partial [Acidobacteriaceae bacterium]|nr:Ig-like domain-containing protein [Acidobacteriaceae bacterium]